MLLACEVRRVLSKHPERIKPDDFLLKFSFKNAPKKPVDPDVRMALAKAKWFAAVGLANQS